ncbi:aquaporin AQPAe.a isoform X1 [Nematostella vectensis]|uniref:aquaporin AQPAe.a isoform X1 n=1 Tax=Nematostella vectensis TaxID=45351 RepID=UPI00138FECB3|nr:aquaporin AQPAe.a isoform X1 [Nematostella vectensis]
MKCEIGISDLKKEEFWVSVFAEFLATFFFVFMVCGSCLLWDKNDPPAVQHIALCAGLGIATWAMAVGHWSGGHINPAVTVGFLSSNKIAILQGVCYIVAQFFGGIAGSAMLYGLTPVDKRGTLGATVPNAGVSTGQAFGIEFLLTFLLVLTIFATTDAKRNHYGYEVPLAIGLCVTVCHLVGIRFTGCGINPARSFGPAVIMNIWTDHWVYWAGPVAGAILASLLYHFVFRARKELGPNADKAVGPEDVELH